MWSKHLLLGFLWIVTVAQAAAQADWFNPSPLLFKNPALADSLIKVHNDTLCVTFPGTAGLSAQLSPSDLKELKGYLREGLLIQEALDQWGQAQNALYPREVWLSGPGDTLPLSGIRIALDPGHIAGTFEEAKIEGKYVELPAEGVQIFEANHTLATARLLKARLEAKGATVLITIDSLGLGARGIPFDRWWKSHFYTDLALALDSNYIDERQAAYYRRAYQRARTSDKRTIYRGLFNLLDLIERARKINEFRPDFSLVIHFNVEVNNAPWTTPCQENGNMAFVAGAFLEGEFDDPRDQAQLVRLALSNDLAESTRLCGHMTQAFSEVLDVPLVTDTAGIIYLNKWCVPTEVPGVYARNLSLTRLIEGPLCYGETLYQDNIEESQWLNDKSLRIGACTYNPRILQVVDAYEMGLERYLSDPKRTP